MNWCIFRPQHFLGTLFLLIQSLSHTTDSQLSKSLRLDWIRKWNCQINTFAHSILANQSILAFTLTWPIHSHISHVTFTLAHVLHPSSHSFPHITSSHAYPQNVASFSMSLSANELHSIHPRSLKEFNKLRVITRINAFDGHIVRFRWRVTFDILNPTDFILRRKWNDSFTQRLFILKHLLRIQEHYSHVR